jgi:acyl transferase domain-containing protein/acyl carrier protein
MSEMKKKRVVTGLEIAVIGMSGRFAGAGNLDEFWQNIKNGIECFRFFSDKELEEMGIGQVFIKNPKYVKVNGILEDKEYFDSSFFGYSHREAEVMDPQLRLFHECAWQALEDAGYDPFSYNGSIGIYAGSANSFDWQARSVLSGKSNELGGFAKALLHNSDLMAERISHKLNLRGPSYTLFTACSTSLVAIHLGCRALLTGECSMALAGGVSVSIKLQGGYLYEEGLIQSSDGHCRTFDAAANGTVFGEGVGVVVLKRLKESESAGDHIYAVVKGTAVNNDGMSKVDFTAPSVKGQAQVIKTALKLAKVEPETIGYIEAHGTATKLGDPIEISALTKAFGIDDRKGYCAIGSVKTNIGHLDTAAGVASFIKTVLALNYKLIPPSLHFNIPNPNIDFENSPFYVNNQLSEWQGEQYPLRAGVSSFGIGGTNAHVILEEAPEPVEEAVAESGRQQQLILLSAKTETALDQATANLAEFFRKNPDINLAEAAYTLHVGRKHFQYRRVLVCSSVTEALDSLSSPDSGRLRTSRVRDEDPRIVFMFSGQGAQYENMGWQLYETEPVLRAEMDRCFDVLSPILGYDIKHILYPQYAGNHPQMTLDVNQTEVAQPILFVFEYALARLLMHWGIHAEVMIGHSIGEYVAACLAGVFSLEDVLKLVALRGRLMQQMPAGSMLSVSLAEEELEPLLTGEVSLAAVNAPSLCVVSGPTEEIEKFSKELLLKGHECRILHTSHAFHSKMMEPILDEFREAVAGVERKKPEIPYISNVTGEPISWEEIQNPAYFSDHLRRPVRFYGGIKRLIDGENTIFVEVGPGKALSSFVSLNENKGSEHTVLNLIRHPKESVDDDYYLLSKLGHLWLHGKSINWTAFHEKEKNYRIPLPPYPFKGQKYWIDEDALKINSKAFARGNLQRRTDIADWFYIPAWEESQSSAQDFTEYPDQLHWLIFADDRGIGERLAQELNKHGQHVVQLNIATEFCKKGEGEYFIDPANDDDYDAVFRELQRLNQVPQKIVHLWNVVEDDRNKSGFERLDKTQDLGLFSLLNIAQTLGRLGILEEIQLLVITNNMYEIAGEKVWCPERATLMGAVKVVPLEYPNIRCRCIDIACNHSEQGLETKPVNNLLAELLLDSSDPAVAIRGSHRWVPGVKPLRLKKPHETARSLKEEGVYLITGGFGGIGFSLAQHLGETVKARLILTGRSEFPGEEKIQELEALGARIMIERADVTNLQQMQEVVARVRKRFGRINGVLHAAGEMDYGGIIQGRTREKTECSLTAKVKGTLVLDRLFKGENLDFLVLFSSIGNHLYQEKIGQVGGVSANEFLEVFAMHKSCRGGTPTITICWSDWLEVGMVVKAIQKRHHGNQEKVEADIRSFANFALSPAEGVAAFDYIMESPYRRIAVFPVDLRAMVENVRRRHAQESNSTGGPGEPESGGKLYQRPELTTKFVAPANEMEQELAGIFRKFVGIDQVGIHDDFFEMGGNSLIAVNLISMIHKKLHVKVPLSEIFNRPTIKGLSLFILGAEKSKFISIEPAEEKRYHVLSSAQKRLYIVWQIDKESTNYNQPEVVELNGNFNRAMLEKTFSEVIERHEILRTAIIDIGGEPFQRVFKANEIEFKMIYEEASNDEVKYIVDGFIRPFDLSKAPLMRVGLIKLSENRYILMFDLHHIATDRTSNEILKKELMVLARGGELPPFRLQYKDFSEWQQREQKMGALKKQEEYWLKEFQKEIPVLNIPTDFARPSMQSFEGKVFRFQIGEGETAALNQLAQSAGTTIFMVLLAIYNILLSKIGGVNDIVVGISVAGRRHVDLERLIGMFVNTLALRNYPTGKKTFREFLDVVRERTLSAFENQDYQFDDLVDKVVSKRDMSRNPLFDAMFVFQNIAGSGGEVSGAGEEGAGLNIKPYNYESTTTRFDLNLQGFESYGKLYFSLDYCTKLFKRERIEWFVRYFKDIISLVLDNPGKKLSDIRITYKDEKQEILSQFSENLRDE